jgi:hypothetical protein
MYVRKSDLFISGVLIMYTVFFALSPPAFVKTILSHPVGVAGSFGVAIFTAMYYSRAVGGLLIIALLASMTQTTEHMTQQERNQIQSQVADTRNQISAAQASTASDKQQRIAALNVQLQNLENRLSASNSSAPPAGTSTTPPAGTGSSSGTLPPVPPNTTVPSGQTAAGTPPIPQPSGTPARTPRTTAPPPSTSPPPRAVAACNIENFASF